jgi:S1-C subfamily serine protease
VLAVAKVLPTVVNINTERVVRRQIRDPFEEFAAQFFGSYHVRPREIRQTLQSIGSGFMVDGAGHIVTNQHVVDRAADLKIEVLTHDGKTHRARFVTGDDKTDLAFIKIETDKPLPFVDLNHLSPNLLGQTVMVVGNALGYGSSISRGVLSGVKRDITIEEITYSDLLQTDAAINPGNSGGPVIDINGALVGVSSAKMAFTPQGVPTQGLGFAIPGETVRARVEVFREIAARKPQDQPPKGSRAEALFGLQLQDLTPELTAALGFADRRGVLVTSVEAGSPAAEVGIGRGLVIYRIGKYEVNSVREIEELLEKIRPGTSLYFTVGITSNDRRGPRIETVSLTAH